MAILKCVSIVITLALSPVLRICDVRSLTAKKAVQTFAKRVIPDCCSAVAVRSSELSRLNGPLEFEMFTSSSRQPRQTDD